MSIDGLGAGRPDWAPDVFATTAQWKTFISSVRSVLPAIDPAATLHEAEGFAEITLLGASASIGLESVARQCVASGDIAGTLETWAGLVVETAHTRATYVELAWEEAAPLLRVQLCNARRRRGQDMVVRELAPDLYMALVLDSEIALTYPGERFVATWGRDEEELFDRAMDNLYTSLPVTPTDADVPSTLQIISGDDDYTAAAAFVALPDHVDEDSLGALVTFPTKFTCSFIALGNRLRSDAMQVLLAGAWELFENADGALTPNLYWWRDHELALIPVVDTDGARVVQWPPELEALIR